MNRDGDEKKNIIRDIIMGLHQGISVEEARDRFDKEVGQISSSEIAEIEQSLMEDGMSPDEIKEFCNVHALMFESALRESRTVEEAHPAHPVYLFGLENREIEKMTRRLKEITGRAGNGELDAAMQEISRLLEELRGIETHYTRKEQVLFPYLERCGFEGPSKVMWGKHNEIRDMLKSSRALLSGVSTPSDLKAYVESTLNPLLDEVEGMVFKEEHILFPTALEKLKVSDWVEILKQSKEVGYAFIDEPAETSHLVEQLKTAVVEEPVVRGNSIQFPTGEMDVLTLMNILNMLPVELTFVDQDDTVRYFTDHHDRIFVRTGAVIGRKVQNCHPPQSLDLVEKILASFRSGDKDDADFWLNFKGKLVYIKFLAIRDRSGQYLGALEVTQDATRIKNLEGEKRLLGEDD